MLSTIDLALLRRYVKLLPNQTDAHHRVRQYVDRRRQAADSGELGGDVLATLEHIKDMLQHGWRPVEARPVRDEQMSAIEKYHGRMGE